MNRPSQKYTFLPDKHYNSNLTILKAFRDECLKELRINPEGIQLPLCHIKLIRKNEKRIDRNFMRDIDKSQLSRNSHTDGDAITNKITFTSDIYNNKNYSISQPKRYKTIVHKNIKQLQYIIATNGEYIKFKQYDN